MKDSKMKIVQWNVRGFRAQYPYLLSAIDKLKPDILALQETADCMHVSREKRWKIKSADWDKFRKILKMPNEDSLLTPTQACGAVSTAIYLAAEKSIEITTGETVRPSSYYWTKDCTRAKREKNRALTRYRNHKGNTDLWTKFKKAQAIFRKTIKEAKNLSWDKFLSHLTEKTTSSEFWKHIKKLRNKLCKSKIVLMVNDKFISDEAEVADVLAQHFARQSCGKSEDPEFENRKREAEKTPVQFEQDNSEPYNREISSSELCSALESCCSKSPGPDTIPYDVIKNFSKEQQDKLLIFYNFTFRNGFPHQWREGNCIPISKPNKPTFKRNSYRPITLNNCLGKLLGKILNRRLRHFLEMNNYYTPYQSGFRAAHSTYDCLIRFQHSANDALRNKKYCIAVFLDIAKAFDTVCHTVSSYCRT